MNGTISLQSKLKGAVTMANTIINGGASPYPKSASGDIITITDGADNTPLKSCVVNIEPSQDLHGYSYPWPAGGGKNKLDVEGRTASSSSQTPQTIYLEGCTATISGDTVTAIATGGWSKLRFMLDTSMLVSGQTYTFSAKFENPSGGEVGLAWSDTRWRDTTTSTAKSVNLSSTFTYSGQSMIVLGYIVNGTASSTGATVTLSQIQLEAGSAPTSFVPYSNICPISGWSEVKVWVKPTYDTSLTPTDTIPLGQTVYGGTVDAIAGKMVIDRVYANISQTYQAYWLKSNAFPGGFFADLGILASALELPPLKNQTPFICSHAKTATTLAEYSPGTCLCDGSCNIRIMQASDTVNDWKAYLYAQEVAGTPVQAVFELATPIEVDLTPQTIKTLLGVNNIWADAGEMSIEYYPAAASIVAVQNRSTKMYVSIPLGMIRYETYQITPQQTIDLDSYRSENGNLLRNPVATKCKLEFNTPLMTDTQWGEIWNIIKAGFNNNTERKLKLKYYDTLSATYKTGYFYVPDVQTTIRNINEATGTINYNETRLAFIEY